MQENEDKPKTKTREKRSRKKPITTHQEKKQKSVFLNEKSSVPIVQKIDASSTANAVAMQLEQDGLSIDETDKQFLKEEAQSFKETCNKAKLLPISSQLDSKTSSPDDNLETLVPDKRVEDFLKFMEDIMNAKNSQLETRQTKSERAVEEISRQLHAMHVEEKKQSETPKETLIYDPFPNRYSDNDPEYANVMDGQMPTPMWGDLAFAEPTEIKPANVSAPADKKKIPKNRNYNCGLFFGTFDPIHDNHVRLFKYALENHVDVLYLIVNEESHEKEISTPLFHRKLMVTERLLEDDLRSLNINMFTPRKKCSDWYGRNGVSSAIHQMEAKRANCPVAMFQIIGEDSFFRTSAMTAIEKLSRTHGINRSFLVFPRLAPLPHSQVEAQRTPQSTRISYKVVGYRDPFPLSSTQIRVALSSLCDLRLCIDYQETFDKMKNRLHKTTVIYITNFKLYHSPACMFQKEPKMVEVD